MKKLVRESLNEGMYDYELHQWLIKILDWYDMGDSIETVVEIFRKNFDLDKNQIYTLLVKKGIDNPRLIKVLFDRFDDLRLGASNI